ncbi:LysM peptidoglycan-binding domain-containing protein [Amycolatopsis sp. K13G38]|uniref:LysM peptidoglycan-binding domain-containing protein n=1 Tax=Amycolatopsis acididurans TaxID=2724524 RepID=A0ABX1IZM8_9PSEU|nr:LysM peptidoglycan-binding domain-containing protein [Amycolatopsis acididurans]NKQ52956.1 LysM peptidoglycan-binding domain-containing protein [Amycolatopsis acididurans]
MTVLLDGRPAAEGELRERVRARRRPAGEIRRPPTRARYVAGHRRPAVSGCGPRRVMPRWPWLAAVGIAVALVVTGLGVFANQMPGAAVPERTAVVTVGDGQSLWDVARQYAPDADAGQVVARIQALNDLRDASVVPGLPLTVPIEAQPSGDGS